MEAVRHQGEISLMPECVSVKAPPGEKLAIAFLYLMLRRVVPSAEGGAVCEGAFTTSWQCESQALWVSLS